MYKICIVGLGYVGLPLSLAFSKYYNVIGFDLNKDRIKSLKKSTDINKECEPSDFINKKIKFTFNELDILDSNIYIITVPTPINKNKKPDLKYVNLAFQTISKYLNKKNIIILESTVYPGLTEELSKKFIENKLNFELNKDFYLGYSPERINPGDKKYTLKNIKKIISASNSYSLAVMNTIYGKIIKAGLHKTKSIKIAEAAKVIENTQRDINIAYINELSIIFDKMNLNTHEILKAANTKWNFLNFKPGLVGGHCIGVDPYYLTFSSLKNNYTPNVILSGRKINDDMPKIITKNFKNRLKINFKNDKNLNLLIMGITFKENCSDIRNSKSIEIYEFLDNSFFNVDIYDPLANYTELKKHNIQMVRRIKKNFYNGIIILVAHDKFKEMGIQKIKTYGTKKSIIYDFKNIFDLS